jgi:hypothetical protein
VAWISKWPKQTLDFQDRLALLLTTDPPIRLNDTTLKVLLISALTVISSLSTGCGNVGAPLPPLIQIPVLVSDLKVQQFGKSAHLSWTLPKLNTDGSAATTVATVEIYRLATDRNQPAPDSKWFAQSAHLWKSIPKQVLDTYPPDMKLSFSDTFQEFNAGDVFQRSFHYAVRVVNNKKQSAGLSKIVSLTVSPLPTSPENLHVVSLGEQHTELGWDLPKLNIDGSAVNDPTQFNVYRRADLQSPETRLNQTLVKEARFKDESIELDKSYVYSVRPVVETPSGPVEGEDSQLLEVTNADTYPPKPPGEVTAISSDQGISLVWLPNTEADLAGYWVYRSGQDKKFERLQDQLLTTASIIDKSAEKGQTYFYRVKAVDLKGNASEFSEEVSDTVE